MPNMAANSIAARNKVACDRHIARIQTARAALVPKVAPQARPKRTRPVAPVLKEPTSAVTDHLPSPPAPQLSASSLKSCLRRPTASGCAARKPKKVAFDVPRSRLEEYRDNPHWTSQGLCINRSIGEYIARTWDPKAWKTEATPINRSRGALDAVRQYILADDLEEDVYEDPPELEDEPTSRVRVCDLNESLKRLKIRA